MIEQKKKTNGNFFCSKEVMSVIPKNAHNISDMKPEKWNQLVYGKIREIDNMSPQRSKVLFLGEKTEQSFIAAKKLLHLVSGR